jgi:hypothetical protein
LNWHNPPAQDGHLKNTVSSTGINASGDRVRPGASNGEVQAVVGEGGTLSQMSIVRIFV